MYITDYGKGYSLKVAICGYQSHISISQKEPIDVFEKVRLEDGLSIRIRITYNGIEKHFMIIDCIKNDNKNQLWFFICSDKVSSTCTREKNLVRSTIERFYNE